MKKIFASLILFILLSVQCIAVTIEGKITYTEESARKITFENIQTTIPYESFRQHTRDWNYEKNMDLLKYGIVAKDREVEAFKKWKKIFAYAVTYYKSPKYTYYYLVPGGYLIAIDIVVNNKEYPKKFYKYNTKGELFAAGIQISENEGYLFDKNQKLLVHRIDNSGYNRKGRKMWEAELLEY